MSIQSEVDRINGNVASTYSVLSDLGADMPATTNTNNLPATATSVKAVLFGKSQSLTEAQKAQARTNIGAISAEDVGNIATTEEIVQQVIAALGTPVFGRVDEDNNIILSGELADGTYTVKYEDAEGNLIDIGALTYGEEEIVNQIPISTDTDGTIFNGKGWNANMRVSSSGTIKTQSGYELTGFIPFVKGDILRGSAGIIGLIVSGAASNTGYNVLSLYNSSKTFIANIDLSASSTAEGMTINADDSFAFDSSLNSTVTESVAFVRVTTVNISDESIITVNQAIV